MSSFEACGSKTSSCDMLGARATQSAIFLLQAPESGLAQRPPISAPTSGAPIEVIWPLSSERDNLCRRLVQAMALRLKSVGMGLFDDQHLVIED